QQRAACQGIAVAVGQNRHQQCHNGQPQQNDQRPFQPRLQPCPGLDPLLLQGNGRSRRDQPPPDKAHQQQQTEHSGVHQTTEVQINGCCQLRPAMPDQHQQQPAERQQAQGQDQWTGGFVTPLPGCTKARYHMPGQQQGKRRRQGQGQWVVREGDTQQPCRQPQGNQRIEHPRRLRPQCVTG